VRYFTCRHYLSHRITAKETKSCHVSPMNVRAYSQPRKQSGLKRIDSNCITRRLAEATSDQSPSSHGFRRLKDILFWLNGGRKRRSRRCMAHIVSEGSAKMGVARHHWIGSFLECSSACPMRKCGCSPITQLDHLPRHVPSSEPL
jgi:hypothetical protein